MSKNVVQLASHGTQTRVDDGATGELTVADPVRFTYLTPALEKLIEALIRSVNDRGILTVVTGGQGSGKTTLLQQFIRQARQEWELCLVQASYVIGEKHILEQLNNRFFPHNHYDVETLADRLASDSDKCWPVILVDDAHNLSSFALDVLLSLKFNVEEQGGRLGLIFLALPSIQMVLSSPSLLRHDETVRVIDMPALTEQQTLEYIDRLLEVSVPAPQQSLTQGQKQAIFRRSMGVPGMINPRILQMVEKNSRESSPLALMLRTYLLQSRLWGAAVILVVMVYGVSRLLSPAEEEQLVSEPPLVQLDQQASQIAAQQEAVMADRPVVTAAVRKAEQVNTALNNSGAEDIKVVAAPALPVVAKKPPVAATASIIPEQKAGVVDRQTSPVVMTQASVASDVAAIAATGNEPVNGQAWLLALNSGDYTIQLAASAYEDAIERFIRKQPPMTGLRYVHIVRRGKDWYVTLFGSYPSFATAKEAIAELPASLRKNDPWIRRIGALQDMLPASVTPAADIPEPAGTDVIPAPLLTPEIKAEAVESVPGDHAVDGIDSKSLISGSDITAPPAMTSPDSAVVALPISPPTD